jgi:hypothetical protein
LLLCRAGAAVAGWAPLRWFLALPLLRLWPISLDAVRSFSCGSLCKKHPLLLSFDLRWSRRRLLWSIAVWRRRRSLDRRWGVSKDIAGQAILVEEGLVLGCIVVGHLWSFFWRRRRPATGTLPIFGDIAGEVRKVVLRDLGRLRSAPPSHWQYR